MSIPSSRTILWTILIQVIVVFFSALAIFHLSNWRETPVSACMAAVVWLALVGFTMHCAMDEFGGVRPYVLELLREYSHRQFVEVEVAESGTVVQFGFELFSYRFVHLQMNGTDILSVHWHAGQASGLAGRDMDDWGVALWYRASPKRRLRSISRILKDEEIYFVGPMARKKSTDEFGHDFVSFLQATGVRLQPTEDPTEFSVTGKSRRPPKRKKVANAIGAP